MRIKVWFFISILFIVYLAFKTGDFEIYLDKTQDKFSKEVTSINTISGVKDLEEEYKTLVYQYLSEKKNKDTAYKYDKNILNIFLREIHKEAYLRKEKIRQKECVHILNQVKNLKVDSNNLHIGSLYKMRNKLAEYDCEELALAEQLIYKKISESLKYLYHVSKNKLKSLETLDELSMLRNKYKEILTQYEEQIETREAEILTKFYNNFIDDFNERKYEIQQQVCHEIIREEKRYSKAVLVSLDKIDMDNMQNIVFQTNQFSNVLRENNCTQEQISIFNTDKNETFQNLRNHIVNIFMDSIDIEPLSIQHQRVLDEERNKLQIKANEIAQEYGREMVGLHPIIRCQELGDRDKKVAELYLIKPFKEVAKEYTLDIARRVNTVTLDFIQEVYEKFIDFCEVYNLNCFFEKKSFTFIEPYKVFEFSSELTNDYKEEGLIWNTLDEALSFVPILGDAKEFLGVNVCKDEDGNIYEAQKDLNVKIKDMTGTIEQNLNRYRKNLMDELPQELASIINIKEEQ